jgi:hypothetical protein
MDLVAYVKLSVAVRKIDQVGAFKRTGAGVYVYRSVALDPAQRDGGWKVEMEGLMQGSTKIIGKVHGERNGARLGQATSRVHDALRR